VVLVTTELVKKLLNVTIRQMPQIVVQIHKIAGRKLILTLKKKSKRAIDAM